MMKEKDISWILCGWISLGLLLSACAPSPATQALVPTNIPNPTLPEPTWTAVPITPTTAPTQTATMLSGEVWDLLVLSDSSNWGVGQRYAELIQAKHGVQVNLLDCWVGTLPLRLILDNLRDGKWLAPFLGDKACQRSWAELVQEAEVMVLFGNPQLSPAAGGAWEIPESWGACIGSGYMGHNTDAATLSSYKEKMLASCTPETFSTYQEHLRTILDEIDKIRKGRPLTLHLTDFYIPVHLGWKEAGVDDVCTACLSNFATAIQQVADERGVALVRTMDALNGPDHLMDPREKGFIRADGIHITGDAAQMVAELMAEVR